MESTALANHIKNFNKSAKSGLFVVRTGASDRVEAFESYIRKRDHFFQKFIRKKLENLKKIYNTVWCSRKFSAT